MTENAEKFISKPSSAPSIFNYKDYRSYLIDFYHFKKSKPQGYSYRKFSKDAGFSSTNILKLILDGKRNIGSGSVAKFIQALKLDGPKAEYFHLLVKLEKAKNDTEKTACIKRMTSLLPNSKKNTLEKTHHRYLSHWLYPVIREITAHPKFQLDPYWITNIMHAMVNPSEVNSIFQFLIEENFIVKNKDQTYSAREAIIESTDEIDSLAIRNFHRCILREAIEVIDKIPVKDREYAAVTISMSPKHINLLKNKIKKFRDELHEWAAEVRESEPCESVVQINLQMYPHNK